MASKFIGGVFTYDTYTDVNGVTQRVTISLDLNHPEIRRMIHKAAGNAGQKSVEASGALVAKAHAVVRVP